jgi:phosphodiesterase/alkaline phosphatase D-like protein
MKRISKLLAALAVIVVSITGVALAASSPNVRTGPATKVTNTTVVLGATVNPNGNTTDYVFNYGITDAYGVDTVAHSAGHGNKGVAVTQTVTGLTPGTIYHYRITALNKSGASLGADSTFTTTGHPPAAVATGSAVDVLKGGAIVTGSINPEGAPTTWTVEYGTTVDYGFQSAQQVLSAVAVPLPVQVQLSGLAAATLFHYRIVASHGGVLSAGADQTFFTEPLIRPKPNLVAHTSPSQDKHSPYTFTTTGTVKGAGFIPVALRCTGNVGIRYYNGRRQLAYVVTPVTPTCTFSTPATFRRLFGHAPARLHVRVDFRGNGYVAPLVRTDHVKAG